MFRWRREFFFFGSRVSNLTLPHTFDNFKEVHRLEIPSLPTHRFPHPVRLGGGFIF